MALLLALASALFLAGNNVVTAHVLDCYECSSVSSKNLPFNEMLAKKDPCWDPVGNKLTATKCPDGTSCYKQETVLMDVKTGQSTLSDTFYSITRYCGSQRFTSGCKKHAGANSVITTCACTTDECNAGGRAQFSSLVLMSSIAFASLVVTLAHNLSPSCRFS